MPPLKPTFDSPTDWQPCFIGSATGRYPSWWSDPTGPEPLLYQSSSQSQQASQSQPTKERTDK
jgi:hypothetical protein